jgi:hypothetical protein
MQALTSRARIARLAVGLVALAVPFAGASAAQAAIGTSNPVTTDGPDIRSATITEPLVTVCFDGPVDLNGPSAPGDILLTPYQNSLTQFGTAPVSLGNNCIRSTFPGDLSAYTVATVFADTVRNEADVTTNLTDSVPLLGSDTQNGTRGNSTGPDLESVIVLGPENQIAYGFDQDVECNAAGTAPVGAAPDDYDFYDQNGDQDEGDAFVACDGNQVLVAFNPPNNVTTAQFAQVDEGAAVSDTILSDPAPQFSVDVPGQAGRTNDPDLLSSELVDPSGATNQMDFAFDENITQAGLTADEFQAVFSDADTVDGDTAQVINGNVARVTFPASFDNQQEFVVGGVADDGAAQAQDDTADSTEGGKPAGGNAGAFALGYTTGPDALSASTNQAGGQVTIVVDQRPCNPFPNSARLVNDDGVLFGNPSTSVNVFGGCNSSPGPKPVTFQFAQSELVNAVGVYLPGFPTFGPVVITSTRGYSNMDQIVSIR